MDALRVGPASSRWELEDAIKTLRAKQKRMPAHWTDRRAEVGVAIDECLGWWMNTPRPQTHTPLGEVPPTPEQDPGPTQAAGGILPTEGHANRRPS